MPAPSLDSLVSLCKRKGFIFPGSDIYGGLANTWDYGPLGVELKNNVKQLWWKTFVHQRRDMVGLDAAILMNPRTWEASGHISNFNDPLIECKKCNQRSRADKLIEDKFQLPYPEVKKDILDLKSVIAYKKDEEILRLTKKYSLTDSMINNIQTNSFMNKDGIPLDTQSATGILEIFSITCPTCGTLNWAEAKNFNLMFKTQQGVVEGEGKDIYLRPETAQGIFVNFKNVAQTSRKRLPFGIAQIGKSFRNEITPGNFTFRTREFEQMEIEYFFDSEQSKWEDIFAEWKAASWSFLVDTLGIKPENLRFRDHEKDELSHYSRGTTDVEYKFPWGWGELCAAAAYRTDFDLTQHQTFSGQDLSYTDPDEPTRKIIPHVMEPSFGADRIVLAILLDAYTEEELAADDVRTVMKLDPKIAPVNIAILPLSKKVQLIEKANEIYNMITHRTNLNVDFDVTGSIGKRYRRQDEIGTPKCITVDFGTIGEDAAQGEPDTVTIRDRDTLTQERLPIAELIARLG